MNCKSTILSVVLFGLSTLLVGGQFFCVQVWGSPAREIQIGVLLPLTGGSQSTANDMLAGLEVAREHMRYYLQQHELVLNLVIRDSQGDPPSALAALQDLKQQGVRVVIGPQSSHVAEAIVDYANENGILLLSPSSTAISLAKPDNLFRLCPNDTHQARALAMLMSQQDIKTVIPVFVEDNYGSDLHAAFRSEFTDAGGTVLPGISFPYEALDFTSVVPMMEAAAPPLSATEAIASTAVLLIAHNQQAVNLLAAIPTASALGELRWFSSETIVATEDVQSDTAASAFAAKTRLSGFAFSKEDLHFYIYAHLILQETAKSVGREPNSKVLMAWDALWLAVETYRNTDLPQDSAAWRDQYLKTAERTFSAYGFCELDENGDRVLARYALYDFTGSADEGYAWRFSGSYSDEPYAPPQLYQDTETILPANATPAIVTIGALLPLTGELAGRGVVAQQALNLAKEHVNTYFAQKGDGFRIDVAIADTKSDPAGALESAKTLYDQSVRMFIGPYSSSEISGLIDFASDTRISLISPTSSAPSLAIDDRIMRLVTSDKHLIRGMSLLLDKKGHDNVFLVHRDDSYGNDLAAMFTQTLGDRVVGTFPYGPHETNFVSLLTSLNGALVDTLTRVESDRVAVVTYGFEEVIALLGQIPADSALAEVQWFGNDALALNRDLLTEGSAAEISSRVDLTCAIYDIAGYGLFLPQFESMNSYLFDATGEPVTVFTVNSYDALWLAALAYGQVEIEPQPESLWRALEREANMTFGMSTPMFLDPYADRATATYCFYRVQAGDASNYEWKLTALYRNTGFSESDIVIFDGDEPITVIKGWMIYK